jgi:hypothetical protein
MPNIQLEVYYEIEGLRAEAEALGSTVNAFDKNGVTVRVVLPDGPDSFTIPRFRGKLSLSNHDPDPRDEKASHVALLRSGDRYEVRIVLAVANTYADTFQVPDGLLEATRTAVTNFTEWVWVRKGQVWNAPSGEYPRQISPPRLFNLDESTGGVLVTANSMSIRVVSPTTAVTALDLSHIGQLCVDEGRPSLAELLLAEGNHYLWRPERLAPDRAVLMAAMACELAIKTTLRESAGSSEELWVELVIENPRDVSVSAVNLWNKAMKAATGHSLHEENRALFKRLQFLIERRNAIVHKGFNVPKEEAKDLVGAATEAFDWLRTIDSHKL